MTQNSQELLKTLAKDIRNLEQYGPGKELVDKIHKLFQENKFLEAYEITSAFLLGWRMCSVTRLTLNDAITAIHAGLGEVIKSELENLERMPQ